jgi:hypothetical protein
VAGGGGGNTLAYSMDGLAYTGIAGVFSAYARNIDFSPTLCQWVAVGGTVSSVAYSYNGVNWNISTSGSALIAPGGDVQWSEYQKKWVALGTGTIPIITSTDGVTWATSTSGGIMTAPSGVAYAPSLDLWVVVRSGGGTLIMTSPTAAASSWTQRVATAGPYASYVGYAVSWSAPLSQWLVGLANPVSTNTTAISSNGLSWTFQALAFQTTAQALRTAWGNGTYMLAGTGTTDTLVASTSGLVYISKGKATFSSAGYGLRWVPQLSRWLSTGAGTNTLAYHNGITWIGLGKTIFTSAGYAVCSVYTNTTNFG